MLPSLLLSLTLHLQFSPDSIPDLHSFHQQDIDTVIAFFKGKNITVKLKTGESYAYTQAQWSKEWDYRNPFAPKIEDAVGLLDRTFTKVEVPPSFPGGQQVWEDYIHKVCSENQHLVKRDGPARIFVQFIVAFDGSVNDVRPVTNTHASQKLIDLAVRAIQEGPSWVPATQNGHVVTAYIMQPIEFR